MPCCERGEGDFPSRLKVGSSDRGRGVTAWVAGGRTKPVPSLENNAATRRVCFLEPWPSLGWKVSGKPERWAFL